MFMLSHSIGCVRRFFGERARYVVHTDCRELLAAYLQSFVDVRSYGISAPVPFGDARSTWRKWAPTARLDADTTEIYLDSDVFLLAEPDELRVFCSCSSSHRLLFAQEEFRARWPYGVFGARLRPDFVAINAGIVGQRNGTDISRELASLYRWWTHRAASHGYLYHDEQGALAMVAQRYCSRGQVALLAPSSYRVVCPLNDPPVLTLAGLKAVHATYSDHPAFWLFIQEIAAVSGMPLEPPIAPAGSPP